MRLNRLSLVFLGATALTAPAHAQELPTAPVVASGQVTIATPAPGSMTVTQGTINAIVNWDSFSIGTGGTVHFNQPGVNAVMLNHVTGDTPSTIAGQLTSTGQIFIVNPNGIAITSTGVVQTSGFAASTLEISNEDFLAGTYAFEGDGSSATVSNAGQITATPGSYVALLGGRVDNSGIILAPFGKVGFGAAELITMDLAGDSFLQVAIPSELSGDDPLISNSGLVSADGGYIQMTAAAADDLTRNVINLSGVTQARNVSGRPGAIVLSGDGGAVTITGTIDTSTAPPSSAPVVVPIPAPRPSYRGGDITITGGAIRLAGATINASGYEGGGDIRIGGDWHGNGLIPTSTTLDVDFLTSITADALIDGNGGTIVLWSDDTTTFAGNISAQGAGLHGKGGDVEVSGKLHLAYSGFADLRAPSGDWGSLLLDPRNLAITSTSPPTGYDAIDPAVLMSALGAADVIIRTDDIDEGEAGNIDILAPLTWAANTLLTLIADGYILINDDINAGGGVDFQAGGAIDIACECGSQVGIIPAPVTIDAGSLGINIDAGAGFNSQTGLTYVNNDGSDFTGITSTGDITIAAQDTATFFFDDTSSSGNISIEAQQIDIAGNISAAGSLAVEAAGILSRIGTTLSAGAAGFTATGFAIQLDGALNSAGTALFTATDSVVLQSTSSAVGNFTINAGGRIELNGTVTSTDGNVSLSAGTTLQILAALTAGGAFDAGAGQWVRLYAPVSSGGAASIVAPEVTLGNVGDPPTIAGSLTGVSVYVEADDMVIFPQAYLASTDGDLILNVSGQFINNNTAVGIASALRPAGRFLIYSTNWEDDTFGPLTGFNLYGRNYADDPPGTIPEGNAFVFSDQPTLTVTVGDLIRMYFGAIPGQPTIGIAGLVNGDTFDYATDGTITATDTTPLDANVGTYAGALQLLGLTATNVGYLLVVDNGDITVTPRPLTITVDDLIKIYGDTFGFTGTEFTAAGLMPGDVLGTVTLASLGAAPGATVAGGPYAITASNPVGGDFANYAISFVPGTLTVVPRALTITADDLIKLYGALLGFDGTEFTAIGLVNGDTVDLASLTSLGQPSDAAAGDYAIAISNASGTGIANYAITYVPGTLSVRLAPTGPSGSVLVPTNPPGTSPLPDTLVSLVTQPDNNVEVLGLDVTPGEAQISLQAVEQASAQFGTEIAECERQLEASGDSGAYLTCAGNALDKYADALENPLIKLPPELQATVKVIRQTAERVRVAAASPNRQDAVREARAAVGELVDFVREQTALVRAVDPETEALLQQQGAVMTQALQELDLQLVGAVEI